MYMKKAVLVAVLGLTAAFGAMAQGEKKALTNADVIAMLDAKLPESTIVLSIQNSESNFDTSPQSLILLKNKGATAGILDAMLNPAKSNNTQSVPKPLISKPKPKVDYKLFTFELNDCQLFGTRITCDLLVTNNDEDRELEIRGSYYAGGKTRLIDQRGNEYDVSKVQLGSYDRKQGASANLVTGVPFKLTLVFDDMPQDMTTISLLDISVEGTGSVQFRNIPLTIATPTSEERSQRVYRNEFSLDFISCVKSTAVVTCTFAMKNNGKADRDVILDLGSSQMVDTGGLQYKLSQGTIGTNSKRYFLGGTVAATLSKGTSITISLSWGNAASVTALKLVRLSMLSVPVGSGTSGADTFNVDFQDLPLRENSQSKFMPQDGDVIPAPIAKDDGSTIDELDGVSLGGVVGIDYVDTPSGKGAVFSRKNESRIQFPTQIPDEGTLEWLVKIDSGYEYKDYKLSDNKLGALIFTTAGPDVWYPGSTWFTVHTDGTLTLDMATTKYLGPKHTLVARNTNFRFGQWHSIGISYGRSGQYIMLDGVVVAAAPQNTQKLGRGGTHQSAVDIPTIGELESGAWANNRYEGGFEGIVDRFRVSKKQRDWNLSRTTSANANLSAGPQPVATPKPIAILPARVQSCAYCGDWQYDKPFEGRSYIRVVKVGANRFQLIPGFEYENKITWQEEVMIRNANGIFLREVSGKLTGRFISANFRATHGHEMTYVITCSLRKDGKLDYTESMEGEVEKYIAKRLETTN
jgi:hypothetical protein